MKFISLYLFCIVFIGCSTQEQVETPNISIYDSILIKSQNSLDTAASVNHTSDSITKENVVKVIKEINFLTNEVVKYKEVSKLKTVAAEKIVYRIDTVYIETKKNFWGKEKTNTSIKSDSLITEKVDTLNQN